MSHSHDQVYLAIITGRNLIKKEQDTNQIYIYKFKSEAGNKFESLDLFKQINIKHIRDLDKICMKFHFQLPPEGK